MANARNVRLYYPYRQYTNFLYFYLYLRSTWAPWHTTFIVYFTDHITNIHTAVVYTTAYTRQSFYLGIFSIRLVHIQYKTVSIKICFEIPLLYYGCIHSDPCKFPGEYHGNTSCKNIIVLDRSREGKERSVLRRQSRDTNRNTKRSVYCQYG